jgi:hypothetical protein
LGCYIHGRKREQVGIGLTQMEIDLEFGKSMEEERKITREMTGSR